MNDWTGNKKTTFATLGASSHSETEREKNDFYATSPVAVHELLKHHEFQKNILEPSCGNGIMSEALKEHGHIVKSSDLIDRGYGDVMDFFSIESASGMDIVTNPPYRYSKQFVEHALKIVDDGSEVAMFLRIQFLQSKSRRDLFDKTPPKLVFIPSGRIACAKNADFENIGSSAQMYAWFIWEKGFTDSTQIKWFN